LAVATLNHFALKKLIVMIALAIIAGDLNAQTQWPKITATTRPWTRWWWMGSAVDENNISSSLKQYSKAASEA